VDLSYCHECDSGQVYLLPIPGGRGMSETLQPRKIAEKNAIEFDSVSKAFGSRTVLKDVSFEVSAGTAFVLLGRSGTGKSVTLKLLCGLLKADSGNVTVNGENITKFDSNELLETRKHMG